MARQPRVVPLGCPIHVTHRGNHREPVFVEAGSQLRYLRLLQRESERCGLDVWAYCLMPNHVHLVVVAREPSSLARTVHRTHGQYAQWVNVRQGWSGHLWAHRYYSVPMDDVHLWAAVRYVESNPVRAGLIARAEDYPWSSARAHAWRIRDPILSTTRPFPGSVSNWSAWLAQMDETPLDAELRSHTTTGFPLGDTAFISRLEQECGRKLGVRGQGRPKTSTE